MKQGSWIAIFILIISVLPEAFGCATCFGKSDSNLAKGMNMGIFVLLIVITSVLALISCFFYYIARRSERFPRLSNPEMTSSPTKA
ncbi:MAG: hypothetical protein SFY81_02200 [Verrucomicrobiota bacterium]|nr:hypothetical protein [Verrucomicrobiota bacterium]